MIPYIYWHNQIYRYRVITLNTKLLYIINYIMLHPYCRILLSNKKQSLDKRQWGNSQELCWVEQSNPNGAFVL